MLNPKILLFLFTLPWMFCGTSRNDKLVPARTRGIVKITEHEELVSETSTFMEQRKPKKKVIPTPDYDSPDDAVIQPKVESPGADTKDDDDKELPTCLMCVCLTGSVYCEEVTPDMTTVPPLPKETAYLYARFNKITKISSKDFGDIVISNLHDTYLPQNKKEDIWKNVESHAGLKWQEVDKMTRQCLVTLRRIDLSGNRISEIEDGAFSKLTQLEELSLAENKLVKLPMLPANLLSLNVNHNQLKTKGVKANAFKKLNKLAYLYLGGNELEAVPPLPESLRIVHLYNNNITTITDETFCKGNNTHYIRHNMMEVRLDGNPLMLAQYPNSFICLRSLPIGHYK